MKWLTLLNIINCVHLVIYFIHLTIGCLQLSSQHIKIFHWICFVYRMAARCFWDADTDSYAQEIYMNVSVTWLYSRKMILRCDFCSLPSHCLSNVFLGQLVLCSSCFWCLLLLMEQKTLINYIILFIFM